MNEQTIFFSYSRKDAEKFALKLASDLSEAGVNVWMDQLSLEAGLPWDRQIAKALKRCQRFLIILSPESMESENVMDEVSYAKDENKQVIPILYKKCHVDFRLRRLQHIDYTADYDQGFTKLLAALNVKEEPLEGANNIAEIAPKDDEVKYQGLYISYAFGGESEKLVSELQTTLLSNNIQVYRDKEIMDYKDSFKTSIDRINKSVRGVIVVISDKYLKSTYCMYELISLYNIWESENLLIPIVLEDAKIYDAKERQNYSIYWNKEMLEMRNKIKMSDAVSASGLIKEFATIEEITQKFEEIIYMLGNVNNLSPDIHRSTKFDAIIEVIKKRLSHAE
jgi:hypothetical protein